MKIRIAKYKLLFALLVIVFMTSIGVSGAVLVYSTNTASNAFTFVKPDNILTYYEIYEDGNYGFYYGDKDHSFEETLKQDRQITEAGYAVFSNYHPKVSSAEEAKDVKKLVEWGSQKLNLTPDTKSYKGSELKLTDQENDYFLYKISQTKLVDSTVEPLSLISDFMPEAMQFDHAPLDGYANKCISNFAKGIYKDEVVKTDNVIRTPQQMRNISEAIVNTGGKNFIQELALDFSQETIGGTDLEQSVVTGEFYGTYMGGSCAIQNLTIESTNNYVGLFANNKGTIKDIALTKCSIKGGNYVGGITGQNATGATITSTSNGENPKPRLIFLSDTVAELSNDVNVQGNEYVGGITGDNQGLIDKVKVKDSITVKGNKYVGGIAGTNNKLIRYPQVYGTFKVGAGGSDEGANQVSIEADAGFVGGIAGQNLYGGIIEGSATLYKDVGYEFQDVLVPNVGGYVKISATSEVPSKIDALTGSNVGGITGYNEGELKQATVHGVSISDEYESRSNTSSYINITGSGNHIGGLVGYNGLTGVVDGGASVVDGVKYARPDVGAGITIASTGEGSGGDDAPTGKSVGGIAGKNTGTIDQVNIRNAGNSLLCIKGAEEIGGIVGTNGDNKNTPGDYHDDIPGQLGTGKDSVFISVSGNIEVTANRRSVGGIAGRSYSSKSNIQNALVYDYKPDPANSQSGSPSAPVIQTNGLYAGGIIGINYGSVKTCAVFSTGGGTVKIRGAGDYYGGIVGYTDGVVSQEWGIKECAVLGDVAIIGQNWIGGILGGQVAKNKMSDCKVGNNNTIGDAANLIEKAKVNFNTKISYDNISGDGTQPTISGNASIGGFVGHNDGTVSDCVMDEPISIIAGGYNLGGIVGINSANGTIEKCDVRMQGISNYTFNKESDENVKRIAVIGGIAGANNGTIEECDVDSPITIEGLDRLGGIVGETCVQQDNPGEQKTIPTVENCNVSGGLTIHNSGSGVGGIAGANGSREVEVGGIKKTYYIGNIIKCTVSAVAYIGSRAFAGNVGGIVGVNRSNVRNSTVNGTITLVGSHNVGGIVGYTEDGEINNCEVGYTEKSNIVVDTYDQFNAGGIAGYSQNNSILSSRVGNATIMASTNAGGIAGYFGRDSGTTYPLKKCTVGDYDSGANRYPVVITAKSLNSPDFCGGLIGNIQTGADFGDENKICSTPNDGNVKAIGATNTPAAYPVGNFAPPQNQKGRLVGSPTWGNTALPNVCEGYASIGTSETTVQRLPVQRQPETEAVSGILSVQNIRIKEDVLSADLFSKYQGESLLLTTRLTYPDGKTLELADKILTEVDRKSLTDTNKGLQVSYRPGKLNEPGIIIVFELYTVIKDEKGALVGKCSEKLKIESILPSTEKLKGESKEPNTGKDEPEDSTTDGKDIREPTEEETMTKESSTEKTTTETYNGLTETNTHETGTRETNTKETTAETHDGLTETNIPEKSTGETTAGKPATVGTTTESTTTGESATNKTVIKTNLQSGDSD